MTEATLRRNMISLETELDHANNMTLEWIERANSWEQAHGEMLDKYIADIGEYERKSRQYNPWPLVLISMAFLMGVIIGKVI